MNKPQQPFKTDNFDFDKDLLLTVCSKNSQDYLKNSFTHSEDMNLFLTDRLLNDTCPSNQSLPINEFIQKLKNSNRNSKGKC